MHSHAGRALGLRAGLAAFQYLVGNQLQHVAGQQGLLLIYTRQKRTAHIAPLDDSQPSLHIRNV
jgi:hypothetical protein